MSKENERDHLLSEIEGWEHNCKQLQTQVTNLTQACTLSKAAVESMQSANDKLSGEVARLQKENEGLKSDINCIKHFNDIEKQKFDTFRMLLKDQVEVEPKIGELLSDHFFEFLSDTNTQGGENENT